MVVDVHTLVRSSSRDFRAPAAVRSRWSLIACFVLATLPIACAGGKDGIEKNLDALRADIARLEAEQDRMSSRLGTLEVSSAVASARAAAPTERPPLPVVVLQPPPPDTDNDTIDPDGEVPVVRIYGNGEPTRGKPSKAKVAADAGREYDEALGSVRRKQYDKGIEGLTAFLVHFPGDDRADNALFWMGECYLGKGDQDRAAEQYESLVARFPKGNKAPDALLKLAGIAKQKGDADRSRDLLRRLRNDFPSSDAARRAPKE
jgi:tol-pal system protein YbgF